MDVCVPSSSCKQGAAHLGSTLELQLLHQQHHTHVSGFSCEHAAETDMEEKKLLNKVDIFVFSGHTKYSGSFIKLRLMSHGLFYCCPYYLSGPCVSYVAVYWGSEIPQISLICVPRSNGFGTTWGWIINDRIFLFRWTIPLTKLKINISK